MSSKKKKRNFDPISLAFLDVMSCGFGAAILLFLIIDHNVTVSTTTEDPLLSAEVAMLEVDVREGQEDLFQIRNTLDQVSMEVVEAQGLAERIESEIEEFMAQLAALEG
ncbi:MAG: VWA domain-containing protein, partial [Gammaproteobacteria bacterium]|nr:VWA domain-containing protein [Gammaproteobacteria bacterium]